MDNLGILSAVYVLSVCTGATQPTASGDYWPNLPPKISQLLQSREYAQAAASLREALKAKPKPDEAAFLTYVLARAYFYSKDYDKAIRSCAALEEDFPQSVWVARARFCRADALAALGRFKEAQAIYEQEVKHLVSLERKDELAGIYIEIADKYFTQTKPDWAKARQFYALAQDIGPKPQTIKKIRFRIGLCDKELSQWAEAGQVFADFLRDFPDDEAAPEAMHHLAAAQLAQERHQEARQTWRDLAARYPKADRWVALAAYHVSRTYRLPSPPTRDDLELGVASLEAFVEKFASHELAAPALLDIGQSYMHAGRHEDAVKAFQRLIASPAYAASEAAPLAKVHLGQCLVRQKRFADGIAVWRQYLGAHPTHGQWSQVQQAIVDAEYAQAADRLTCKQYAEAARLFEAFLAQYPLDRRAPEILLALGQMEFDQKQFEKALEQWARLVSKYPQTDASSRGQYLIGLTLEEKLDRPAEAIKAYEKVTWGPAEAEARTRLERMKTPELVVQTERVFRTQEPARLRLVTRNIPKLSLRMYKVDMVTYFRKMHAADGLETLDIGLIDPDKSWEFAVPGYADYRTIESQAPVPLEGPGVVAITVSSEKLQATTMLIVSDLDVIVKVSRNELFVFAQNMRTRQAQADARLLISDGNRIFAEGVTGRDGVYQQELKELQEAPDVRVLAYRDGHVAGNRQPLRGLRFATGLAPRGYVYTDRPAYQPGQMVGVRGVVRWVEHDQYTFKEGQKYRLDVIDPAGRPIHQAEVALGRFGTLAAHVKLPEGAALGVYRVHLHEPAGQSYAGTFMVQRYPLEPVALRVHVDRTIYLRGEAISGRIELAYYYGAPLAHKTVRYRLANEPWQTAQTDARGQVAFTFQTRQFREEQPLDLVAVYPERNLRASQRVFLAVRAFKAALSTARDVYLAGESFDVDVTAVDWDTKPVATEMELAVLRREPAPGQEALVERQVAAHKLATDKEGKGRLTLRLSEGGRYVLRASAVDRFGNPVTASRDLLVSGDDDQVRLRILADKHQWRVGDTAPVKVVWREADALGLVTYEAARVLGYRIVTLKKGENDLAVLMQEALAPNFDLAVAVMTEGAFHTASSPFTVERQLRVTIRPGQAAVQPGDEVTVELEATDQLGRPVEAELSLAMVDQAVFARFPDTLVPIHEFFSGGRRQSQIRTTASCTFRYQGRTAAVQEEAIGMAPPAGPAPAGAADRRAEIRRDRARIADGLGGAVPAAPAKPEEPAAPESSELAKSQLVRDKAARQAVADRLDAKAEESVAAGAEAEATAADARATAQPAPGGGFGGRQVLQRKTNTFAYLTDREAAGPEAADDALPIGGLFYETGYWNPAVVTDAQGRAKVSFRVPERSAAWRLTARGASPGALFGQAQAEVVSRRDFFGELKLPLVFTEGDQAQVLALVHNQVLDQGRIEVRLKTTAGDQTRTDVQVIEVKGKGIHEAAFDVAIPAAERITLQLSVSAAGRAHGLERTVAIEPYGLDISAASSGTAQAEATTWVGLPEGYDYAALRMQILIGPTLQRSLLDAVLAPEAIRWCGHRRYVAPLEHALSDLLGALAMQELLGAGQQKGSPQWRALEAAARGAIAVLVVAAHKEGGWCLSGREQEPDPGFSSRAVWALSLARRAGYDVPAKPYEQAVAYLQSQFAAAGPEQLDVKAALVFGLAAAGKTDFGFLNRLYRSRAQLTRAGLLHTALAFLEAGRGEIALELVKASPGAGQAAAKLWMAEGAELAALELLVWEGADPRNAKVKELADWLLAHRVGLRWAPERATGVALVALGRYFAAARFADDRYRLSVRVNDRVVATVEVSGPSPTTRLDVPPGLLRRGKNQIAFLMDGRGQYAYSCLLTGFGRGDQVKATTDRFSVHRQYEPAPLELDGEEIPRGFGILSGSYSTWTNPLTQLPVGKRAQVTLHIGRPYEAAQAPPEDRDYLVIEEPIPSGTTVVEGSVRGGFEHYEIAGGKILFYFGNRPYPGATRYDLYGYLPGRYRVLPTVARSYYRPERLAVAPAATITVLPADRKSADPYRLTPQELFELGKRLAARKEYAAAAGHLTELIEKFQLQDQYYRQAVRRLLDISLAQGHPRSIVRYFEIIHEKYGDEMLSFDDFVRIGVAYRQIDEFERSLIVFRTTAETSFQREGQVPGQLDGQGQFLEGVAVWQRLLAGYPEAAYTSAALYQLSQHVRAKADQAATHPQLKARGVTREALLERSLEMLERFLALYPENPAADEAGFQLAGVLVDLDRYQETIDRCQRLAALFPKSPYVDSFWYLVGFSQFSLGRHHEALATCQKVADTVRLDPRTGAQTASVNKWEAIYILGQIRHSMGQAAKALEYYRQVQDRFPDARECIEHFQRKAVRLPEVTIVRPGQAAAVELAYRNIAECQYRVYRIDLMKLLMLKHDLSRITHVNLAGIQPAHQAELKLGDGRDYADRTRRLDLPLTQEGAYLVVCRGDDLHCSGLVLVTPLDMTVDEEPSSGRVRVMVRDAAADKPAGKVEVGVAGSRRPALVTGRTDLRGLFVADGIRGRSTAVARAAGDRYAFFRGKTDLLPEVPTAADAAAKPAAPLPNQREQLLGRFQAMNRANVDRQVRELQQNVQQRAQGVQAGQAKF